MDLDDFGSLQLRVLEMLWERGQASAGELWERWPEKPEPAYTTVLGPPEAPPPEARPRRKRGRARSYAPRSTETPRRKYARVRRKVFRPVTACSRLLGGEEVSDGEFQEIQKLLRGGRKR